MDIIQGRQHIHTIPSLIDSSTDWAAHFLGDHEALHKYAPYARQAFGYISTIKSYMFPLLDQISKKPDLATIALLLIIIFVSLKILNMLWQTLLFWVGLARKLVFWGGLVSLAVWMYARGPEGVMEDVDYWWQVWTKEYQYWREREDVARLARQGQPLRGGGGKNGWF